MNDQVSVLITAYKRPHTLETQISAIESQTCSPKEIVVWQNGTSNANKALSSYDYVCCKNNKGVWPRFAFPLYAFDTKYVAIFDDDTIPGEQWFENCINVMDKTPGLLGTNGVIFQDGTRHPRKYVGWSSMNHATERADIVGHCWFFERNWLRYFMACEPAASVGPTCGEDYHFSYALQRAGIPTYVPPHPKGEMALWGSTAASYGMDDKALYMQPGEEDKKLAVHNDYRSMGWKTLSDGGL